MSAKSNPRTLLSEKMAKLSGLEAQTAAVEREYREAVNNLREAEGKLESFNEELAVCSPMSRKPLRAGITETESSIADLSDYVTAIRAKQKSIKANVDYAKGDLKIAFSDAVAASPGVHDLVARYKLLQAEQQRISATLNCIGRLNLPRELQYWDSMPAPQPIAPDPEWTRALAALQKDAFAPLPGDAELVEEVAEAA